MTNNNNEIYENNNNENMIEQQQVEKEFTVEEYEQELNYFQEYDQEMLDTIEHFDEDYIQQQEEEEEEEPYMMDESLLKLIVDVQSYLAEAQTDSPLFSLQYKMYTYLKQRALEMGMDIPPSI